MRRPSLVLLALAGLVLTGCAMPSTPAPQPTLANIETIRAGGFVPMTVGAFTPAPGAPSAMDHAVTVRASSQSPQSGSYAKFLGETLAAELQAAGRLDPHSTLVISGVVTKTHVDSAMPKATAELEARFTLSRAGVVVFDKLLDVSSTWDSAFMGAVAIPDAFNHYNALFPEIVTRLLSDADFKAAARAPGA